jgi:hypothetical protein
VGFGQQWQLFTFAVTHSSSFFKFPINRYSNFTLRDELRTHPLPAPVVDRRNRGNLTAPQVRGNKTAIS